MDIEQAIANRWSARAFLDKAVAKEKIEKILQLAARAPSGTNHQPWHVAVLQGETKQKLSAAIIDARHAGQKENPDYQYYMDQWDEPYLSRRKACGIALYKAQDIKRDDLERRQQVWEDNYRFFNAPVGLIIYLEKKLQIGSWMDTGMFLQTIMLAALGEGLATCPQESLAEYPDIVREHLQLSDDFNIVCGMSLGYPDLEAPVNQYRLDREPLENFVTWFS